MLDILKVSQSDYAKVVITGKNNLRLEGILQNDLGASGSNSFDTGFMGGDTLGAIPTAKAEAQRSLNKYLGGAAGADRSATNQWMSRYSWTGSSRPEFSVQIALVALKDDEDQNVVAKSMQAMRTVYPDLQDNFLTAPLGYNPSGTGTVRLEIGHWFSASGLVVKSSNWTYSRVTLRSGRPLFALGEIVLEPNKAITYAEFRKYFRV